MNKVDEEYQLAVKKREEKEDYAKLDNLDNKKQLIDFDNGSSDDFIHYDDVKDVIIKEKEEYNKLYTTIENILKHNTSMEDIDSAVQISNLLTNHFRRKKELFGEFKDE